MLGLIELQREQTNGRNPVGLAGLGDGPSEAHLSCVVLGIQATSLGEVRACAVEVSLEFTCQTSIVERLGVFGIEPDRLVVIGDGAVIVARVAVGAASIVETLGEFGIDGVFGLIPKRQLKARVEAIEALA